MLSHNTFYKKKKKKREKKREKKGKKEKIFGTYFKCTDREIGVKKNLENWNAKG